MTQAEQGLLSVMTCVNKNLVLVEPDNAVRTALKTLLQGLGWNVTALKTGRRLDSLLGKSDITAIISESSLPDRLATSVVELGNAQKIPVIFLGHKQQVQDAVDLMRLGAKDFLEKPFPQARLIRLLDSLRLSDRSKLSGSATRSSIAKTRSVSHDGERQ